MEELTYEQRVQAIVKEQVNDLVAFVGGDYDQIKDIKQTLFLVTQVGLPPLQHADFLSVVIPATPDPIAVGQAYRKVLLDEIRKQGTKMLLERFGIFN